MAVEEKKKFSELEDVDINLIDDIPWAQEMWKTTSKGLEKAFLNWVKIVLKMGDNEEVIGQWVPVFVEQIETTCCELVFDMEMLQAKVICNIEQLLTRMQQLCTDLHVEMPVLGTQNLSLYNERNELKKRVEEYETMVKVRLDEINKLRDRQLDVCRALGKNPKIINTSPLPSAKDVSEFQQYIENMELEKFDREERFLLVKEEILGIIKELKIKPTTDFERTVVESEDSKFLVTDENMKQLENYRNSLVREAQRVKDEIQHIWLEIDKLYNMIDVSMTEREQFRKTHNDNSVETLKALELEQKRFEDLKKANIKIFIDKLRIELENLWEKCHCSGDQKNSFQFFSSDCYTEDLLELYEFEIAKWNSYYEEHKLLISLLNEHQLLWNQLRQLDEIANGPNRYKNRGGQLLKEEKERNKLSKRIPQIEKEMIELAANFERRTGVPFQTFGRTIEEYIMEKHEEREQEKKLKLSARKQQREQTLTPAKSALSLFPSSSTHNLAIAMTPMNSTNKRRILTTAATENIKRPKFTPRRPNTERSIKQRQIMSTLTQNTNRSKRLSQERKKRIDKIRRISQYMDNKNRCNKENGLAEYDMFEMELSTKDGGGNWRSTILITEDEPLAVPLPPTPKPTTTYKSPARNPGATPRTPKASSSKLAPSKFKLMF